MPRQVEGDGRFLVVEYKSETSWSNEDSREKRVLGELWEKRSGGACLFVMPKGRDLLVLCIRSVESSILPKFGW